MQFSSVATVDKTHSGGVATKQRHLPHGFAAKPKRRFAPASPLVSPLKYDPLAAPSFLELVGHCLPPDARVDLFTDQVDYVTGKSRWHKQYRHRQINLTGVASQYFELKQAGGGDAYEKIGCTWNGAHRLVGFDIDFADNADHDGRGCNHPENDRGNAISRLRELYREHTGGELIEMHNPASRGIWLLGVLPVGAIGEGLSLAQHVLRKLKEEGYYIGNGRLEIPSGNARLPLAGYVLTGHEDKPWIEQVCELNDWIAEQIDLVELLIPLPPKGATQLELETSFKSTSDRNGVYLGNLPWRPEHTSNSFLCDAAKRCVRAGYGPEIEPWFKEQIAAHPAWQKNACEASKRDLENGWGGRWLLYWAARIDVDAQAPKKPKNPDNTQKKQDWNRRVNAGLKLAVRAGKRRITETIAFLVTQGVGKRLLKERADLLKDWIAIEVREWEAEQERTAGQGDLFQSGTKKRGFRYTRPLNEGGGTGFSGCSGFKDANASSWLLDKAKPKAKKKKGRALTEHLPGLDLIFGRKKVDFGEKKADFGSEKPKTTPSASVPKAPASPKSSDHRKVLDFESSASTSSTERVGFEPTMPKRSDLRVMSPTSYQSAAPLEPEANAPNGFAAGKPVTGSDPIDIGKPITGQTDTVPVNIRNRMFGQADIGKAITDQSDMQKRITEPERVSGRVAFGQSMDCVDFDARSSGVWSASEPWAQEQEPPRAKTRQVLTPEERRDRERAELEAWLAGSP